VIYTHTLDPVLLAIGPVKLYWYGLMYILSFGVGYFWLRRESRAGRLSLSENEVENLIFWLVICVIAGGRLGYFLFYLPEIFLTSPLRIFAVWTGGMSFHGGVIGVGLVLAIFSKLKKINLWQLADTLVIPVALGLFFGRIGNFVNGELPGVLTGGSWGVVFPEYGDQPRHPSQLYEAAKNLLIFGSLLLIQQKFQPKVGVLTSFFFIFYGILRFTIEEFWRLNLDGAIFSLSKGQFWSFWMIVLGILGIVFFSRRK